MHRKKEKTGITLMSGWKGYNRETHSNSGAGTVILDMRMLCGLITWSSSRNDQCEKN